MAMSQLENQVMPRADTDRGVRLGLRDDQVKQAQRHCLGVIHPGCCGQLQDGLDPLLTTSMGSSRITGYIYKEKKKSNPGYIEVQLRVCLLVYTCVHRGSVICDPKFFSRGSSGKIFN